MSIFSPREIARRQDAMRAAAGDLDALLAISFFASYYLSGVPIIPWGRRAITAIPRDGEPAMVLPVIERERALQHSPIADLRTYSDVDGPSDPAAVRLVADWLRARRLTSIGFDGAGTSAAFLALLEAELPGARFTDVSPALHDLMLVSSEEEIALIRSATRIAEVGIRAFIDEARLGTPEVVLAGQAMLAMARFAAEAFPEVETRVNCYSQQGERSLQPHTGAGAAKLEAGNVMALVVEVYCWNYQIAIERAMGVGGIGGPQRRYLEAATAAHLAAIDAIAPGVAFGDVDRAARKVLLGAGYERIDCGTGLVRGLITEFDGRIEAGSIRAYNDAPMRPDMVVTVEPWASVPQVGAPRHCDVVRVTAGGHETISEPPRELVVIGE